MRLLDPVRTIRVACLLALGMLAAPRAQAQACPEPLRTALRLVLVTAASMNTQTAQLRRYERASGEEPWRALGEAEPSVIGKAGMGWGTTALAFKQGGEPEKHEGDQRTPAGFFSLGASFGFEGSSRKDHLILKAGETVCVDDPASEHYNTIKPRRVIGPATSGENMRLIALYRHGLLIDYPSDRQAKRGSCIFVHIWKAPASGTLGCIALPEPRVQALQSFAADAPAVIGIVPAPALGRFASCLPGVSLAGK